MMMKKLLLTAAAVLLTVSLAACSTGLLPHEELYGTGGSEPFSSDKAPETSPEIDEEDTKAPAADGECSEKSTGAAAAQTEKPAETTKPRTTKPAETTKPRTTKPAETTKPRTNPPKTTTPPATEPPATEPGSGGTAASAYEKKVVELVNIERAKEGLSALKLDAELTKVARYKSEDMRKNKYFSHTSPEFGSTFSLMRSWGISYRSAGENIAMGYSTPESVVRGWMDSPGHRANIMSANFTKIGVGHIASGNYWTQVFTG